MADTKISNFTTYTPPISTDVLPIVDVTLSTTKKITIANLMSYIASLSQTLTTKTINLTSNTLTGTTAQFNTALSDNDFATLAGSETLTNKTLTLPIISSISNGGTVSVPSGADTLANLAGTQTFTNKRTTARVQSVADAATVTPAGDTNDAVDITALAQAVTIATPTGTPTNFQKLLIRFKDNGTARAITWNAAFIAGGSSLPATTVLSKILTVGFIYNTANSLNKWQCVGVQQEA